MLYIIDGTGDADDKVYRTQMTGGFCDKMSKQFKGNYYRGPSLFGTQTFEIADKVYREIKSNESQLGKLPLFLAGHSRGGAAAIYVAQKLKKDGHAVNALFLFDAVDRTASSVQLQAVPGNVRNTFHARRDTSISKYFEWGANNARQQYEDCLRINRNNSTPCDLKRQMAIKYKRLDDAMKVRMRATYINSLHDGAGIDFGNCGLGVEDPGVSQYVEKTFLGSHGAMGGSPIGEQDGAWISAEDKRRFQIIKESDRAAMASVWAWMLPNLDNQQLSLHGDLLSRPPQNGEGSRAGSHR